METENSLHNELVLEVLKAASNRISVQDFDIQCQLAPISSGKSYYDRLRTAERLMEQGLVERVDDRLTIRSGNVPKWLKDGMLNGEKTSWEIFETIDKNGKIQGKIDLELLTMIGLEGETEVINQLNLNLPHSVKNRIKHISLTDDTAGFDILSPSTTRTESTCLLEVKTSSKPSAEFCFFISRNEARVASQNDNWRLVAVRREPSGYSILGHLRYSQFFEALPQDTSSFARWESASVTIPVDLIVPSLP